jgi:hypothetical protein
VPRDTARERHAWAAHATQLEASRSSVSAPARLASYTPHHHAVSSCHLHHAASRCSIPCGFCRRDCSASLHPLVFPRASVGTRAQLVWPHQAFAKPWALPCLCRLMPGPGQEHVYKLQTTGQAARITADIGAVADTLRAVQSDLGAVFRDAAEGLPGPWVNATNRMIKDVVRCCSKPCVHPAVGRGRAGHLGWPGRAWP